MVIKKSTLQELDIYVPDNKATKYMRQNVMKLKGKKDKSKIILEYFNTSLSAGDRTRRQKISEDVKDLKNVINKLHLINISRTFYPITAEYTFFSMHVEYSSK